jgi:hypothetical protein
MALGFKGYSCLALPLRNVFQEKMKTEKSKKGINRSRLAEA